MTLPRPMTLPRNIKRAAAAAAALAAGLFASATARAADAPAAGPPQDAAAAEALAKRPVAPIPEGKGDWRKLFNGKDKEGWAMLGPGEFKLENGELVTYGGMGMLWYPGEKFGNCEINVVFQMAREDDNSGVFIRIPQVPKNPMQAVNQGYEVQIDNKDNEWHHTGCLYSLVKAHELVQIEPAKDATMLITLDGPRTVVRVNGKVVTDYTEGDPVPPKAKPYEPNRATRPNEGYIGLQNHGGTAHVHFKEVAVRPLKK